MQIRDEWSPLWQLWRRHSQSLRGGLRGTAVTLVSGAVSQRSVHLLLEDVRQGVQRDAAHGGRVAQGAGV